MTCSVVAEAKSATHAHELQSVLVTHQASAFQGPTKVETLSSQVLLQEHVPSELQACVPLHSSLSSTAVPVCERLQALALRMMRRLVDPDGAKHLAMTPDPSCATLADFSQRFAVLVCMVRRSLVHRVLRCLECRQRLQSSPQNSLGMGWVMLGKIWQAINTGLMHVMPKHPLACPCLRG